MKKSPAERGFLESPSVVAAMPIASAAAAEIQTDTWTVPAVVAPVVMMPVTAPVNLFHRRWAITRESSQTGRCSVDRRELSDQPKGDSSKQDVKFLHCDFLFWE